MRIRIAGGWLYRMRRVLATLGVGMLAFLIGYKAIFGANGMMIYRAKRAQLQSLQQEIDQQKLENDRLQSEVERLKTDPKAIEKAAREQLGYVRPTDTVLVEPQPRMDAHNQAPPPDPRQK